jgi:hypothetical protein
MQIQKSLLITLAFCGASMLSAQTWLDDSFTSGSSGTNGDYIASSGGRDAGTAGVQSPPNSAVWWGNGSTYGGGSTGTPVPGNNPIQYVPSSGIQFYSGLGANGGGSAASDSVTANFTAPDHPDSIAVGDTLDVSFTFTMTGSISDDLTGIRFALSNSGSTASTSNQMVKNTGNGLSAGSTGAPTSYSGYFVDFDPAATTNTGGPVVAIFNRAPSTANTEYIASTSTGKFNQLGYSTASSTAPGLTAGTSYTATLAITNNGSGKNTLVFGVAPVGDTNPLDVLYSTTVTDTGVAGSNTGNGLTGTSAIPTQSFANPIVDSFDTFTIGEHSGETADLLVSNVDISIAPAAIPEPSTYAAILGVATLGFVLVRSRRQRRQQVIAS